MRGELKRHCYRLMGGVQDAEDCVRKPCCAAGVNSPACATGRRCGPGFTASSTRVCLDALRKRRRRQTLFGPSLDEIEPGTDPWVEPWPGGTERGQE